MTALGSAALARERGAEQKTVYGNVVPAYACGDEKFHA